MPEEPEEPEENPLDFLLWELERTGTLVLVIEEDDGSEA